MRRVPRCGPGSHGLWARESAGKVPTVREIKFAVVGVIAAFGASLLLSHLAGASSLVESFSAAGDSRD
jgi:hypothetical protein